MSFSLKDIIPWGRSFEEYCLMFALTENDLARRILGCGDGPASFNATLTRLGGNAISVDPIYRFSTQDIKARIDATCAEVLQQTRANRDDFIWSTIPSPEALGEIRLQAMVEFLADFADGKRAGRYLEGELPQLPFLDATFELALCSHLLFLYSEHLDLQFHLQSLRELCRIARETRIFPLLELGGKPSRHLNSLDNILKREGYQVEVVSVAYQFQKGGNQMLIVKNNAKS